VGYTPLVLTELAQNSRIFLYTFSNGLATNTPDTKINEMTEEIYFSLYKHVPEYSVTIFGEANWVLENRVELQTSIIGKSHRIISHGLNESFTEFISCDGNEMPDNYLDRILLKAGAQHDLEYKTKAFNYRVKIDHLDRLFPDMESFLSSLPNRQGLQVLSHVFASQNGADGIQPFTGLAVDTLANRFYTVHTYPESGFSIQSSSELTSCAVYSSTS